jgi:hypothetical protein
MRSAETVIAILRTNVRRNARSHIRRNVRTNARSHIRRNVRTNARSHIRRNVRTDANTDVRSKHTPLLQSKNHPMKFICRKTSQSISPKLIIRLRQIHPLINKSISRNSFPRNAPQSSLETPKVVRIIQSKTVSKRLFFGEFHFM